MSPTFMGWEIVNGPSCESFEPRYAAAVRRTASTGSVRMRSVKRMSKLSTVPP